MNPEVLTRVPVHSYYRPLGPGRYESTPHAQGAWNDDEQHMAPATGILVHALEAFAPRPELRLARLSFDILGVIHAGEFEIETRMLRPGRTIELVEAEMISRGRSCVRARAWRLRRSDTSAVAACEDPAMPGPDAAQDSGGLTQWPGGYIRSLELKVLPGHRPGRGQVWLRSPHEMVDGEPTPDLVRLLGLVDTANGVASRVAPGAGGYLFPNVDLQIHLHRDPSGSWLGLDTRVSFGPDGTGLTSSVLHDLDGPFGRSEQILTVRQA